jgi:predicted transcriptional regulator
VGLLPVRFADDGGGLAKDSAVRTAGAGETLVRGTALVEFAIRGDCVHYGDEERRQPGADERCVPGTGGLNQMTIQQVDEKLTKVILCGTVFPSNEKAPFTLSRKSIFGGFETNQDETKLKCHECGKLTAKISGEHLRRHGIHPREYRLKHGLNLKTPLQAPAVRMRRARLSQMNWQKVGEAMEAGKRRRLIRVKTEIERPPWAERSNLRMNCRAQLTERLTNLASRLGHTPKGREMVDRHGHISRAAIRWAFRMTVPEALRAIGLVPNGKGRQRIASTIELRMLQLRTCGWSFRKIAEELGVHHTTVMNYVKGAI